MKNHESRIDNFPSVQWSQLVCECGKKFTPSWFENKPTAPIDEITARKRHILHLEEVALKLEYDAKKAKLPADPYREFHL